MPKVWRRERAAVVHTANGIPRALPPTASSRLSVSVCATRCDGRAPTAIRTANSCRRAFRRESSWFERLTQAIRRMQATAPTRMRNGLRNFPRSAPSRGRTAAPNVPTLRVFSRRVLLAARSSCAWASVTPGRRRPMPKSVLPQPAVSVRGNGCRKPISVPGEKMASKSKVAGSTPMMVEGALLREITRPTAAGSALKCARQYAFVTITTGGVLKWQSAAVKLRP